MKCEHENYDDYFEVCTDCKMTKEEIDELLEDIVKSTIRKEVMKDLEDRLKQEVEYESTKDESVLGDGWTTDYREGFADGLSRALEIVQWEFIGE